MDYAQIKRDIPLLNYNTGRVGQNIYEFVVEVGQRANQIENNLKERFDQKIKDYIYLNDEDINENESDFISERTYITQLYEKTPKAYIISINELFSDELVVNKNY